MVSPRSMVGLLTVTSDRITSDFNTFRSTLVVALYIPKAFNMVWHAGLLDNSSLLEFQVEYSVLFCLFSALDNFEWF